MSKAESISVETPAVLVDYERLMANIVRGQQIAKKRDLLLRPHIKTHKCLEIARLQIDAGAIGVTASKTDEAITFINAGIKSVTVAYPIISPHKLNRLLTIAKRQSTDLRVIVDSDIGLAVLSNAVTEVTIIVNVYLKIDVGLHRCGISSDDPKLIPFVKKIHRNPMLRFCGLLSHAGQAYAAKDAAEVKAIAHTEWKILSDVKSSIEKAGFDVPEVSVGSTPTVLASDIYDGITEIRPGNYVFMDRTPVRLGLISNDDVALSVLTTIVSANDEYFIIDAGSKVLSSDLGAHGTGSGIGYGLAYTMEDYAAKNNSLDVSKLSEEHGFVRRGGVDLPIGSRLRVIPNHACPVVNLTDEIFVLTKEGKILRWKVAARGKVT